MCRIIIYVLDDATRVIRWRNSEHWQYHGNKKQIRVTNNGRTNIRVSKTEHTKIRVCQMLKNGSSSCSTRGTVALMLNDMNVIWYRYEKFNISVTTLSNTVSKLIFYFTLSFLQHMQISGFWRINDIRKHSYHNGMNPSMYHFRYRMNEC